MKFTNFSGVGDYAMSEMVRDSPEDVENSDMVIQQSKQYIIDGRCKCNQQNFVSIRYINANLEGYYGKRDNY